MIASEDTTPVSEKNKMSRLDETTIRDDYARIPFALFRDNSVFEAEQQAIFRGPTWHYLGIRAEIPQPGDFKTTWIGTAPIIVQHRQDGGIAAFLNRCAHRGAIVRRERFGHSATHTCVYHQWCYGETGALAGVPFRRGLRGHGGMPEDFRQEDHPLTALRVAEFHGVLFGTFSAETEDLETYMAPDMLAGMERIFPREVRVLGYTTQRVKSNWKLYAENLRDPYHASLLHLFHATFGLYRSSQRGGMKMDPTGRNSIVYTTTGTDTDPAEAFSNIRTYDSTFSLKDPGLLAGFDEFPDGRSLEIGTIFPGFVFQQIKNCLAIRHVVPLSHDGFDLHWTHFGYADDTPEQTAMRLAQANLVGPAGYVSMEDAEACELVQRAIAGTEDGRSVIEMGGRAIGGADHLVTESTIRGFWKAYATIMGLEVRP
jgi:anthranilate 1,2-dioxygenase large subunit